MHYRLDFTKENDKGRLDREMEGMDVFQIIGVLEIEKSMLLKEYMEHGVKDDGVKYEVQP